MSLLVRIRLNETHGSIVKWLSANTKTIIDRLLGTIREESIERKRIDWRAVKARREVEAEVVRMNARTGWFRLPDGNVIKRKLARDIA